MNTIIRQENSCLIIGYITFQYSKYQKSHFITEIIRRYSGALTSLFQRIILYEVTQLSRELQARWVGMITV
ncbi:hypothetical protein [Clostridium sp.]|uniref:hypothetical protein n=1 Tax=Clostridium sp. TaxID=1506 RepID=UPI003F4C2962